MNWLETIVVVIVVGLGLAIFYKALKEPLDLLFGLIGKGVRGLISKISGVSEQEEIKSISYN